MSEIMSEKWVGKVQQEAKATEEVFDALQEQVETLIDRTGPVRRPIEDVKDAGSAPKDEELSEVERDLRHIRDKMRELTGRVAHAIEELRI